MAGMVRVKFAKGKVVHLAFGVYSGRASVLCNRVPNWHRHFEVVADTVPITCPTCIKKGAR